MSLLTEPPAPRRAPRLLIGLVVAVVIAGAAALTARHYLFHPWSPLDSTEGQALGRAVPGFLIEEQLALQNGGTADQQKQRALAVLDPKARAAFGPEVSTRLETLLTTIIDVEVTDNPTTELSDRFARDAVALDQALADRALPYFIDASIIRSSRSTTPMLYSYYIERESTLRGADKRVRTLFVRRLDNLNFASASVGYTKPSSAAALILLDHVEGQLIHFVLPSVAAGDDTLLVDLDSIDPASDWQRDLRARSAAIVKEAYSRVPGADLALVEEIGKLLYRRRMLVRSWMKSLDNQRFHLRIPRRLIPEADYATELLNRIPAPELREWIAIHERLLEPPVLAAFESIRDQQALSVEQHETQHQLDYDRERVILPRPVADMLGVRDPNDVYDDKFASYVASEVSAYLAELVRGRDSPALTLMVLSQSAFDRGEWGGAYCYAALAVLEGIAKELGLAGGKLVAGRRIDRAELTRLLLAITDKPEPELRQAARRTWESWYESKLAEVTVEKTVAHPAWRH